MDASDSPTRRRATMSTARNATPSVARHEVKARPSMPASAPKRASGPSMPNRLAATTAASVPLTRVRSRGMAAHGTDHMHPS